LKNDKKIEGDILKLVVPKKPGELAFISINLDNNVLKELSLLLTNLQGVAA